MDNLEEQIFRKVQSPKKEPGISRNCDLKTSKTETETRMYRTDSWTYGRRRGWDDLRERHRNMYIIKCETDSQSRLDARDKCSGLVHWDDPERWDGEGVERGFQDGEHM